MSARFIIADVFDGLASLPDDSVDLVLSSPPFLALRSYLPADHPDKGKEIGSEATPADFLDTLLDVAVACRRVLAPHGSLVFELGDTYSGSGGAGGDYNEGGFRANEPKFRQYSGGRTGFDTTKSDHPAQRNSGGAGWPLAKSLCGIPHLFHLSLAYGRNLLNGREIEPWRVRNVVAWCRPNPPVGALGDKFRAATSYLTVACMAKDRYFDLDAVRTAYSDGTLKQYAADAADPMGTQRPTSSVANGPASKGMTTQKLTHAGAPPLDWWEIPTAPYKGSHYATWPPNLLVKPILSMCPERVCTVCGEPSRRIVETAYEHPSWTSGGKTNGLARQHDRVDQKYAGQTTGWTDCSHDAYRPGTVLDPFAGSGTTLAVATGHGRDAIGIDLDARNADLARERCGMFLTVEDGVPKR